PAAAAPARQAQGHEGSGCTDACPLRASHAGECRSGAGGRLRFMPAPHATVAVIGGSGFYDFLDDAREVEVATPYGDPSAPVAVGDAGGTPVAFLPRHGKGHAFPPHLINYRANLWALRSLGVRQVLAPCAVGGLRDEVAPGDLVDRTSGRVQSYVETGAVHVPFADPYCPTLSQVVAAADGVKHGGTMV